MKRKSRLTKHAKKGQPKKNRQFKDSVFVSLFSRDEKTRQQASISLYNALHDEKIEDDAEVKFIELKDVLYHKEKNDVSFMLNGRIIVLVEHQSTVNENMPLRFLMYIVAIYQLLLDVSSRYKERLVKIPSPEFYVIYNGVKERPAIEELKLSDAFMECGVKPPLELIVKVININHPDNKGFLEKCELLKGYKEFGNVMSDFLNRYGERGYDLGIEYCIEHGILTDFLSRHIKEVLNMLKAKYRYEDEISVRIEEAKKEAKKEGREEGREEGWESGLAKGIERERGEVVRAMKSKGFSAKTIADILSIKEEVIETM